MREADAENRFGLTSCSPFFHHFSNFLEAWHWPNKILQLAQGLGSYSSLRRTQKALGGRLGGAVEIGGDFFFPPDFYLGWYFGGQKSVLVLKGEEGEVWRMNVFSFGNNEVFGLGISGVQKNPKVEIRFVSKRPTPRAEDQTAGRLRLPGRPRKSWNGRDRKRWCWCRWSCSWSRRPTICGVVGTRLPPQQRIFLGGLFRAWSCLKKKTKKNKNYCDLVTFFPFCCLCDLDLVTLYCTFQAASNLVWWNMWSKQDKEVYSSMVGSFSTTCREASIFWRWFESNHPSSHILYFLLYSYYEVYLFWVWLSKFSFLLSYWFLLLTVSLVDDCFTNFLLSWSHANHEKIS